MKSQEIREHRNPALLRGHPQSVKLAILIILSALGGMTSVLFGYAGNFLSLIPLGSPISGQLLSGFHVYWLILSASILKRNGSATVTGALKGLIEMMLFSHLGILVLLISVVEGLIVDVIFYVKKKNLILLCLAGGFSAASNIVVLQVFLLRGLPALVYAVMYLVSFFSGALLGGYLASRTIKTLRGFFPVMDN